MDSVDTSSDPEEPKRDEIMYIYMYMSLYILILFFTVYGTTDVGCLHYMITAISSYLQYRGNWKISSVLKFEEFLDTIILFPHLHKNIQIVP